MRALLAAGCALLVVCAPLRLRASDGGPSRRSAPLWRELGRPGERRARDLLQQALSELREANRQLPGDFHSLCSRTLAPGTLGMSLGALRGRARALRELRRQALRKRAHVEAALARLERARALAPDAPEVLYALGRALAAWEQPGPPFVCGSKGRAEEASAVLERLRALHPEYMADTVAFEQAVLLTRRGRFAEAARAYADSIALALDGDEAAVVRANLAEVTMLAGDLEPAVEHYERALKQAGGGRDYLLALFGLAVALDRLGEHAAAKEQLDKAIQKDGGRIDILRSEGVFFEPPYEIEYYEALGHEAMAALPEADRARELRLAAESFRAFCADAGQSGMFAAAARASLARVEAALRAPAAKARPPKAEPAPRATDAN